MTQVVIDKRGPARDRFFETEHLKSDLKGRVVRGSAATMIGQVAVQMVRIGSIVVLGRLLTPDDYGKIAMISAVTGFVAMFKDMGLSMATVQREEVSHIQVSTLFWINVALSALVMLIVMGLAPWISWFYGQPLLLWLTLAMAGTFLFGGLTIQHQALLRRQMRFGALAKIEVGRTMFAVCVGILAALAGAGVWSLVFMQIGGAAFNAVLVWIVCPWRPGLPARHAGIRSMVGFGGYLTGFNGLNYFARNLDKVLIGRFCGAIQLGFYYKAYELLMLPIRQVSAPISAAIIPALCRLQNEPEKMRGFYLRSISVIALITMPAVAFLIAGSRDVLLLLIGPQWEEAARVFAVLGFSALIQPIYVTQSWLHVAVGRTDRMFRWGLVGSTIIVVSFVVGIPWGAIGVAISYTIAVYLILLPCLWYAGRPVGLKVAHVVGAIWRPMCAALSGAAVSHLVFSLTEGSMLSVVRIVVSLAACFAAYAILLLILYGSAEPFRQIWRLLRQLRSRTGTEGPV